MLLASSTSFGVESDARELGVQGVPFFVIDRCHAVSGAQPVDVFAEALARAWSERTPQLQVVGAEADAVCADVACAVPNEGAWGGGWRFVWWTRPTTRRKPRR